MKGISNSFTKYSFSITVIDPKGFIGSLDILELIISFVVPLCGAHSVTLRALFNMEMLAIFFEMRTEFLRHS